MQGLQLPAGKRAWLLQPVLRSSPAPGISRPESPARTLRPRSSSVRVGAPPLLETTASTEPPARQPIVAKQSTRPGVRPPLTQQSCQPRSPGSPDGKSRSPSPHGRRQASIADGAAAGRPLSADRRPVSSEKRRIAADSGEDAPQRIRPVRAQSATSQRKGMRCTARPSSARSAKSADRRSQRREIPPPEPTEEDALALTPPQQAAVKALEMFDAEDAREKEARLEKQLHIRAWLERKDAERSARLQAQKQEAQLMSDQERLRQQREQERDAEMRRRNITRLKAWARREEQLKVEIERAQTGQAHGTSCCKATMAVALAAYSSPRPPVSDKRHRSCREQHLNDVV